LGFIALLPGWIDHLYIQPDLHRRGIGSALVRFAQGRQSELRLYTFQSNVNARAFYEGHGFVIEELNDGTRNEEQMPDITYFWRAAGNPAAATA
ncbi:GNAT family N-acetyltransferase, partial [Novosphingobium sp.]|uniref:GNAT family N-acetyltransferase n=1 Tax=Novosphingobium sp. TaxID=1874826 RepID=UPI00286BAE82